MWEESVSTHIRDGMLPTQEEGEVLMPGDTAISIDSPWRKAWMGRVNGGVCSDIHIADNIFWHFALAMPLAKRRSVV